MPVHVISSCHCILISSKQGKAFHLEKFPRSLRLAEFRGEELQCPLGSLGTSYPWLKIEDRIPATGIAESGKARRTSIVLWRSATATPVIGGWCWFGGARRDDRAHPNAGGRFSRRFVAGCRLHCTQQLSHGISTLKALETQHQLTLTTSAPTSRRT